MRFVFVCSENTCRSQMAEGFARSLGIECVSAGLSPGDGVNPRARQVMEEVGVDLSGQYSKGLDDVSIGENDYVVSMCHVDAGQICPMVESTRKANWNIADPKGGDLDEYRQARDLINQRVAALKNPPDDLRNHPDK